MAATRLSSALRPRLELLETRQLLSGFTPTPAEQLFLEELNDARADPAQYGTSIGVDLSGVAPSPPLAFNTLLIEETRLHSQDMNARGYFAHDTPEGIDPGQRMTNVGFVWTGWGESLAGGTAFPGPTDALRALIIDNGVADLGHRRHLLAIDPAYQGQNQVGIGIVQGGTGPLVNYYTIDTASAPNAGPFLTGTVFNDLNDSGKYDIGEGLGNVTISVAGVGSTTTFDTGGYSIAVPPGTYTVTASGGPLAAPLTQTVTVGTTNVRLNFALGDANYVQKLYQMILGRTGSSAELQPWEMAMQGPMGPAGVVAAIAQSSEARTRLVDSWYVTYLGRSAQGGEEQGWVAALLRGATEEQLLAALLSSDEFFNRAGTLGFAGTPNQQYIEALYSLLLKRSASSAEVSGWQAALATAGRNGVAAAFLHSTEYRTDVVEAYYTGLLGRTTAPSPAEMSSWVTSGLDFLAIREAFESSQEFRSAA
jgi:hypothetical protein